jgi:hypothetical protein
MNKRVKVKRNKQQQVVPTKNIIQPHVDMNTKSIIICQSIIRMYLTQKYIRQKRYTYYIIRVQAFWRRTLARMHIHSLVHKKMVFIHNKSKAIILLTKFFHQVKQNQHQRIYLLKSRIQHEVKDAGRILFELSCQYNIIELTWKNTCQIENIHVPYEIQKLFQSYSQNGMILL